MIDSNTQYDGPLPSKVCPFPLTAKSQVYCRSWDGSQVGELTSYGLPAVYWPQQQHVSKGLQTNLIWKSGPAQFLTSNFTSPSNVVWDSQGLSGLHDRTSERTHIHGSAVQKLDVEGLARRDGERVDVHGRALDRRSDVIK